MASRHCQAFPEESTINISTWGGSVCQLGVLVLHLSWRWQSGDNYSSWNDHPEIKAPRNANHYLLVCLSLLVRYRSGSQSKHILHFLPTMIDDLQLLGIKQVGGLHWSLRKFERVVYRFVPLIDSWDSKLHASRSRSFLISMSPVVRKVWGSQRDLIDSPNIRKYTYRSHMFSSIKL